MYLSKLEIFGFKSFANRTTIKFTKGLTGIVGPNGCGKTNIVDALRWALGEQRSSTLRSDKMENVIFNGTRNKKPMGMSEVSLTLVNDNGQLPTEYSEVTITRRIFRSGESEYLLNKNICRLKDITNLFMDTGMGTNAYSVIELKMVETILSNKADERRRMFEEAAGVNKYKLRRRLALKKLDDVKLNLTRVNDIVSEVEKKVRSLERQAKRASKYNQLQTILREKELDLCEREMSLYTLQITSIAEKQNELKERKNNVDKDIREIENKLILFRDKTTQVETQFREKQSLLAEETNRLHTVQKNISVAQERTRSLEANLERFNSELDDLFILQEENEHKLHDNRSIVVSLQNQIDKKSSEISLSEANVNQKRIDVEEQKNKIKDYKDNSLEKFKDLSSKKSKLTNLQNDLARNNKNLNSLNDKIQTTTNTIAKTVGYLEDLGNERSEIESKLKISEEAYTKKKIEKETLEAELSGLKVKELEDKSAINSLKDKIDFFQTLITNLEGVSKASKLLLESDGWSDNEKTLFADVGNPDEEYRFALEAALNIVLNNLLIENVDDLTRAVEYLKKNELGKASFFLLKETSNNKKSILKRLNDYSLKKKRKKLESESKFIKWAYELVETDEKWKPYFNKILYNTAITQDLDTALELSAKYPEYEFATMIGDIVKVNGIVEGGSEPAIDDTLFGRKQLLENLKDEYPKLEKQLAELREQIVETENKVSGIDLNILSEEGKILINESTNIDKQISQLEYEKTKADEEIEKAQSEIDELTGSTSQTENLISELNEQIELESAGKEKFDEEITIFEDELKLLENNFNSALEEHNGNKVELERLNGQLQNADNEIARAENSLSSISNSIRKNETSIEDSKSELETLTGIIDEYKENVEEIEVRRNALIAEAKEIETELNKIKNEAAELEQKVNSHRSERETISEDLHQFDINSNEIKYKLNSLKETILDEYSLELQLKEFDDLDHFNFKETRTEVHNLKNQIKNLGPINLLAYSEFEEEKERFEFLSKQREDLLESEKDLAKTIKDINASAQEIFAETFLEIKANFQKIFRTLFDPGDEADLIMEENADPLEAKIEIVAKPKGKRPTSIELLSGGEKTLTATALLFAIYLVKPSPFCVLDEVDAPLDDANIDRFTKLLLEFKTNTQFIVVTHNKRTMGAVENMYGVTMQEEGISKLAGVQFNEEISVN
ncbi:MAG: chromosome segregation protein SMC [Ignavibacteriae bacterium]|nr:chromosome segregation protein SMC [Ignavibacteriota bacterium]NOG96959.1 chromosome segregation protein SMC [Ignavibacteriota bacterium]